VAPLPIMVTSEFAFSTKLTLKPDDGWQHQSLLLRLLKVAAWNGLNGDELAYVFGADIFCQEWLLNKPQDLPWRKLRHLLKESNRTLSQAYPPFSLPIGHIQPTGLRGCRQCYQIGFHSALYLIPFLGRCPLHDEPIVDGCPKCACPVPYAITNQLTRTGFRCPNCQRPIFNLQDRPDKKAPNFQKLSLWRNWLFKLSPIQNRPPSLNTSAWIEAYRQWNLHYGEIPQHLSAAGPLRFANPQGGNGDNFPICGAAACGYYRARRINRHQFSRTDKKRYNELIFQTWCTSLNPADARIIGFIFWRLAWERSFALDHVGINLKQRHFPVTIVHWLLSHPLADTDELLSHIYQEFWQSYWRCQWLTQWMQDRGGFLVTTSVMKLILPAWCIRRFRKKNQ